MPATPISVHKSDPHRLKKTKLKGVAHIADRDDVLSDGLAVSTKTEAMLSPKQKAFIKFMGEGDSQSAAAIRAGHPAGSAAAAACNWMKLPIVRELIAKEREQYAIAVMMTKQRVMEMHMEAFEMAKLLSEPATMVSAAREMGKLCGYYEPKKVDVTLTVNGAITQEKMKQMSDAELLRIIEGAQNDEDGDQPALGMS